MSNTIEDTKIDLESGIECPSTKTTKIDCFGIERSQAEIDARNKCWFHCLVISSMTVFWMFVGVILIGFIVFPVSAALTTDKTAQIVLASISGVYAFALLCVVMYGLYLCGRKYVFFV